jgi:hypothetical protein
MFMRLQMAEQLSHVLPLLLGFCGFGALLGGWCFSVDDAGGI